jgi:2-polyprenyl-3-methyl-5-hydroxy-6-metoxy-1,4-benzoquinol methylase
MAVTQDLIEHETRTPFAACPLCGGQSAIPLRSSDCSGHPLWAPELGRELHWTQCADCQHVFTAEHWNARGFEAIFRRAHASQLAGANLDQTRFTWAPVVERVCRHLGSVPWSDDLVWLDVGCGNGGLVMTADEFGFLAIGIDAREESVRRLSALGYQAQIASLEDLEVTDPVDVVSLADVLEHVPHPRAALGRVRAALRPGGLLLVSCPNMDAASWRAMDLTGMNPYWQEIEHFHNFGRVSLTRLLVEEGFVSIDYAVSTRYKSCMEVIARRI